MLHPANAISSPDRDAPTRAPAKNEARRMTKDGSADDVILIVGLPGFILLRLNDGARSSELQGLVLCSLRKGAYCRLITCLL